MNYTYWKCNKALSAAIFELKKQDDKVIKQWTKLSKSVGGDPRKVVTSRFYGSKVCEGFVFKQEPDKKLFYQHKQLPECWVPRAGTETRKQMDSVRSTFMRDLCQLIGYEYFRGLSCVTPGVKAKDDIVYITLDYWRPTGKGLRRISDLTFEKVFAK
jgi:hypothetical protein